MDANALGIKGIFNGGRLIEVPFYQRSYVWGKEQWEQFLDDMEYISIAKRPYFLGSIILKREDVPTQEGVSDIREVIDGQQRLTTILIFFKVFHLLTDENSKFVRSFCLENDEIAMHHSRIDAADFKQIMSLDGLEDVSGDGRTIEAYNFFRKHIDPASIDRDAILRFCQFVCVDLGESEDEQQIFDTINSLGVRLTTAELLKNYFFDRSNIDEYENFWQKTFEGDDIDYWEQEIITGRIRRSLSDVFFDAFLKIKIQDKSFGVSADDKKAYDRTDKLFQSYKDFISKYYIDGKGSLLPEMKDYADSFISIFDPEVSKRPIPAESGIERINLICFSLSNTTLIPYVLFLSREIGRGAEFDKIMGVLESYIMRRMSVRATSKNYNRLFTSLILNKVTTAEGLSDTLNRQDDIGYVPTDDDVLDGFQNSKLTNLQAKGIIYLVESKIRHSYQSTALLALDQYSLEHIMPKKWRNNWDYPESEEAEYLRDKALLCLGNLTIITQEFNSSIRDADWQTKKNGTPGFNECSKGIETFESYLHFDVWDESIILNRGRFLGEKALQTWQV